MSVQMTQKRGSLVVAADAKGPPVMPTLPYEVGSQGGVALGGPTKAPVS